MVDPVFLCYRNENVRHILVPNKLLEALLVQDIDLWWHVDATTFVQILKEMQRRDGAIKVKSQE